MNLKHIIASLFVACAVFTSCAVEEDEIFDQPASLRADATAAAYNQILTSAQNGWVMEYYPSSYQSYGGFVVACKFNANGTVNVSADYATDSEGSYTSSSLYQVTQDDGIMLSIDTYNEVFHYLSTPSSDEGAGSGKGFEGDFDFHILSCSAEKVVLKGTKTGSKAEMYPLAGSVDEYFAKINKVKEESRSLSYITELENVSVSYSLYDQVLSYNYKQGEDEVSGDIPFVYTTTGIKFFETAEIAGKKVSELTWDGEKFVSKDGFVMELYLNAMDIFLSNTWYMSDKLMDNAFLKYWYTSYVQFIAPNELNFSNMYVTFQPGYLLLHHESELGSGYLVYQMATSGSAFSASPYSYDSALTAKLWSYTQFQYLFYPFWGETFTVEIDDMKKPTMAILTNADGDQLALTIAPSSDPFAFCKSQAQ